VMFQSLQIRASRAALSSGVLCNEGRIFRSVQSQEVLEPVPVSETSNGAISGEQAAVHVLGRRWLLI